MTTQMTTQERVKRVLSECAVLGLFDPYAVAEHLCDQDVVNGEYEGCSSELELAFMEYEREAAALLRGDA